MKTIKLVLKDVLEQDPLSLKHPLVERDGEFLYTLVDSNLSIISPSNVFFPVLSEV